MTLSTLMERDMRGESETVRMLREDNNWLYSQLNIANMARAQAEANVARLRRNRKAMVPGGDAEGGYECGNMHCCADIKETWDFCPFCGCEVDWRTWVDPETGDPDEYDRRFDR